MKRIATIQDFSCIGKCSLAVALPILSAAGVECCGIPTALLSNHTGFSSFYQHDLTDEITPIADQLMRLGIGFDAIYTGYIASIAQMDIAREFINRFRRENTLIFVDPVMGDNGKLYSAITEDYAEHMRELCAEADIITPNITEAYLLINKPYNPTPSAEELRSILELLLGFGAKKAVITGAARHENETGALGFDGKSFFWVYTPKENLVCSGTGDIFSSALLGAVMRGQSFGNAIETAVNFTYEAVKLTNADPLHREYGVNFEQALPLYIKMLEADNDG